MKRNLYLSVLLMALLFTLTGCGNSSQSSSSDSSHSASTEQDVESEESNEVASEVLTFDYFIPTNLEAIYFFTTTGKNIESIDKDGLNFEVMWKKIGDKEYESRATTYFENFVEKFRVEENGVYWIGGIDSFNESEIYESKINHGERIEFLLANVGEQWTNDYVVETKSIDTDTKRVVEQIQILGHEKIQIWGEQKEAIKVLAKTDEAIIEKWYVKGLGLVKMINKLSNGEEESVTELIAIDEGK